MSETKDELTISWLIKSKRDLQSAIELAESESHLLDTASYHCQQAAEKAVKAFLLYHDVRFDKTHDIEVLVFQAQEIDPEFSSCVNAARILTPLAIEYRYPGIYVEPEEDEYRAAFDAAVFAYNFVVNKLPVKPLL